MRVPAARSEAFSDRPVAIVTLLGTSHMTNQTTKQWVADTAPEANGSITIRLADGSEHGNTDAKPIATVYDPDNARLIALAPEMLDAIRGVMSRVQRWIDCVDECDWTADDQRQYNAMEAVLTKIDAHRNAPTFARELVECVKSLLRYAEVERDESESDPDDEEHEEAKRNIRVANNLILKAEKYAL